MLLERTWISIVIYTFEEGFSIEIRSREKDDLVEDRKKVVRRWYRAPCEGGTNGNWSYQRPDICCRRDG